MQYVNPLDLLKVATIEIEKIESEFLKREKKRLAHEIELSDIPFFKFNGSELNKSDVMNLLDELNDSTKKRAHYEIYTNPSVKDFLYGKDVTTLPNKQFSSETIKLISPFFASQYSKLLKKAVQQTNVSSLKKILSIRPLVLPDDIDNCYNGTRLFLTEKLLELGEECHNVASASGIAQVVKKNVPVEILNELPNHFQTIRNDYARTIRNISVDVHNEHSDIETAIGILSLALALKADGVIKSNLAQDKIKLDELFKEIRVFMYCWFCGINRTEKNSDCTFPLYHVTGRAGRSVWYKELAVTVPRCNTCKVIHGKTTTSRGGGAILGGIVGFFVGGPIGAAAGAALGAGGGHVVGQKEGVKLESEKKQFPPVKKLLSEGWQLSKPGN